MPIQQRLTLYGLKRLLLGQPLSTHLASEERIPKWKALSTLSSDALSSVAYAGDAILITLAAFSAAATIWSIPIAVAITLLLIILTFSYRQTIEAYPNGGGAYTVAKDNLGIHAGLIAGAALLIDYILTVSVSVASGVENLAAAFPLLNQHRDLICALVILVIMIMNLRGIRESATIFAFPTYFFIFSVFALIVVGLFKYLSTGQAMVNDSAAIQTARLLPVVPKILLLRAFASGCAALTGIEAISNGVTVFKHPTQKNAKTTMIWMSVILGFLFLGVTLLAHLYKIQLTDDQTLLSLLGTQVFGRTAPYFFIQFSTALILFLAANTSYADFPRLASLLAKDRYLPRQLASVGDRLVFSNGIVGLSFVALFLIVLQGADTQRLLPLYAVGVFLSFTISQAGMVVHHWKKREDYWIRSLLFNALGALTTLLVLSDIAWTKFMHGAWVVVLAIPVLVWIFKKIHEHYLAVGRQLSLIGQTPSGELQPMEHIVLIPISGIHRGIMDAVKYSLSISKDVRGCYVEIDPAITQKMKSEWENWYPQVPFVVLPSPYRSVVQPLLDYLDALKEEKPDEIITVVVPEFVTSKAWQQLLHNQTALFIRAALALRRGKVVTSVRYHLKST